MALAWDSTTIVIVEARGGGGVGLGYTYSHARELLLDQGGGGALRRLMPMMGIP